MNRQYKSSVLVTLFSDERRLRELYNAIAGTNFGEDTEIVINTLQDVLFMERQNDISFTIGGRLVVLIEHQSTINPNAPLRLLLYIARVYEKLVANKALYREKVVPIPPPEFYVLYNGVRTQPDCQVLRLSDAFTGPPPQGVNLELTVKILNINQGHNPGILAQSEHLGMYAAFIDKAREYNKAMPPEEALKKAIYWCINNDILKGFLEKHSSEVRNMLLTEWNWDDAKEVWQEEARETGMEQGLAQGLNQGRESRNVEIAKNALKEGFPITAIQKITGLSIETIEQLALEG
jgi:hypothetical protein